MDVIGYGTSVKTIEYYKSMHMNMSEKKYRSGLLLNYMTDTMDTEYINRA